MSLEHMNTILEMMFPKNQVFLTKEGYQQLSLNDLIEDQRLLSLSTNLLLVQVLNFVLMIIFINIMVLNREDMKISSHIISNSFSLFSCIFQ